MVHLCVCVRVCANVRSQGIAAETHTEKSRRTCSIQRNDLFVRLCAAAAAVFCSLPFGSAVKCVHADYAFLLRSH